MALFENLKVNYRANREVLAKMGFEKFPFFRRVIFEIANFDQDQKNYFLAYTPESV